MFVEQISVILSRKTLFKEEAYLIDKFLTSLFILQPEDQKLKLKIFIGMSAKLIANGHVQIYKYTEYGQ